MIADKLVESEVAGWLQRSRDLEQTHPPFLGMINNSKKNNNIVQYLERGEGKVMCTKLGK